MVDKINMPSGSGGLTRYFEEYKSKIQIKPELVIGMIILVIILSLLIRIF